MFGYTKNGFLYPSLSKKSSFYFSRFKGFNYFKHVPKLVFFLILEDYFASFGSLSFTFDYYFIFNFYLVFFYYLGFFFTFYLMVPNYSDYLKLYLLLVMGEAVLTPDFDKLFEMVCLILILSEE